MEIRESGFVRAPSASLTGEKAAFTAGSRSALILSFLLILAF